MYGLQIPSGMAFKPWAYGLHHMLATTHLHRAVSHPAWDRFPAIWGGWCYLRPLCSPHESKGPAVAFSDAWEEEEHLQHPLEFFLIWKHCLSSQLFLKMWRWRWFSIAFTLSSRGQVPPPSPLYAAVSYICVFIDDVKEVGLLEEGIQSITQSSNIRNNGDPSGKQSYFDGRLPWHFGVRCVCAAVEFPAEISRPIGVVKMSPTASGAAQCNKFCIKFISLPLISPLILTGIKPYPRGAAPLLSAK